MVDCTFGAGGHARLVADRLGPAGTLVCIDRDPAAEERFDELAREVRLRDALPAHGLRRRPAELLAAEGVRADVVYLDLGISSMQVDARERGFSYSYDAPLDMRMDPSQELDARDDRERVGRARGSPQLLRRYGEERYARRIAREIVRRRERAPIDTTGELVEAIKSRGPGGGAPQFGGGHPAKRIFQAIRIAVNDELESLERALPRGVGAAARRAAAWPRSPSTRSRTAW